MKHYSCEEFREDVTKIVQNLGEKKFDAIMAIARGGLTLSHALAQKLNIRDVRLVGTKLYDNERKLEKIELMNSCSLEGLSSVLVVDDIADSGETLSFVMSELAMRNRDIKLYSCTIFYKKSSIYEPNIWLHEAQEWIEFFWEA